MSSSVLAVFHNYEDLYGKAKVSQMKLHHLGGGSILLNGSLAAVLLFIGVVILTSGVLSLRPANVTGQYRGHGYYQLAVKKIAKLKNFL